MDAVTVLYANLILSGIILILGIVLALKVTRNQKAELPDELTKHPPIK
jgi:hypothetical protein